MPCLWFIQIFQSFFSTTDLNGVVAIMFFQLDLDDLAPVYLNNSARDYLTPIVPEVCHSYLIAEEAYSSGISVSWSCLAKLELRIDLVFEAMEGPLLVGNSMGIG